jgi:F-type H+-transporting ATPase subunit c
MVDLMHRPGDARPRDHHSPGQHPYPSTGPRIHEHNPRQATGRRRRDFSPFIVVCSAIWQKGFFLIAQEVCEVNQWPPRGQKGLDKPGAVHYLLGSLAVLTFAQEEPNMESGAAAFIGMGLAALGFAGASIGIGMVFSTMIESVARQPEAEAKIGKYVWIGFALVETVALYGLVVAFLIMGLR